MSLQRESSTGSLSTLSEESVHEEDISTKDKPEANKAVTSKPKEVPTFNPREYNMLFFAVSIMKENLEVSERWAALLYHVDLCHLCASLLLHQQPLSSIHLNKIL